VSAYIYFEAEVEASITVAFVTFSVDFTVSGDYM